MRCIRASLGIVGLAFLLTDPAVAQIDGSSLKSSSRSAPRYESGRSTGSRMGFTGPESSARPGVFFFDKAVDAFEKEQYAFAIEMYQVAASWAYKPAEYNLSVMYAKGEGIPVDLPRAMAWIALAAERGDSRYVSARDAINVTLSSNQVAEANRILGDLKPRYADETALKKAYRRWRDVKRDITGSRIGSGGGVKVGGAGQTLNSTSPGYEMTTAWGILGGGQNDASIEYRQLHESKNPYDPKYRAVTPNVTIGELVIPDLSKTETPAKSTVQEANQ